MKKFLMTFFAMVCCFGLLACGSKDVTTDQTGEDKEVVENVTEETDDVTEETDDVTEETGDVVEETGDVAEVTEAPVVAEPTIDPNSPALAGEVKIDEVSYQFPMSYADFMALDSWTTEEDITVQLKARDYDTVWVAKNEADYFIEIYNGAEEALAMDQCLVTGIGMRWMDYDAEVYSNVVLPSDVKLGVATQDEIIAAYGAPNYEVEKQLQYVPEGNQLFVQGTTLDMEDNVLHGFMVKNRGVN